MRTLELSRVPYWQVRAEQSRRGRRSRAVKLLLLALWVVPFGLGSGILIAILQALFAR